MGKPITHVIGFDDAPFERAHRGDVRVVGAVFCGARLEGVLSGKVRRDGANATRVLTQLIARSRFRPQLQAVMVQGIAFAGFNVIDLHALAGALGVPAIAVARRRPDVAAVRRALLSRVPGGRRKWKLIEKLGPMQPAGAAYFQCAGIAPDRAAELVRRYTLNGALPEPLRTAHLIAGGVTTGQSSRHRA